MFPKAALTLFVVGVLSANALIVPVARSPAPEPESQELEAWMLKRDLSYELFSRELQALNELFSREPGNTPPPVPPKVPIVPPKVPIVPPKVPVVPPKTPLRRHLLEFA